MLIGYADAVLREFDSFYKSWLEEETGKLFHSRVISFGSYEYGKYKDQLERISPYDPNGYFSLLYAKGFFLHWINDLSISIPVMLENPDSISGIQHIWTLFHNPEFSDVESTLLSRFNDLIASFSVKQIGERNPESERDSIVDTVLSLCTELPECNLSLFLKGGSVGHASYFSTRIHFFPWLRDCLGTMENAQDGVYLCYIRNSDESAGSDGLIAASPDGYFSFFLKSNGTLLSVSDRIDESYPGEHGHHRNARYSNSHKFQLFPYDELFSYSGHDYTGTATEYRFDPDNMEITDLPFNACVRIVAAMMMISYRYNGFLPDTMPVSYVDSLSKRNLASARAAVPLSAKALIPAEDSAIAVQNAAFQVNLSDDDIIHATCAHRLSHHPDTAGRHHSEYGCFPDGPNIFVELFADGFRVNRDAILSRHEGDPEYVGTATRMEIAFYKEAREQLAEHIRERIYEEYTSMGGVTGVHNWYTAALRDNRDHILHFLARAAKEIDSCGKYTVKVDGITVSRCLVNTSSSYQMDSDAIPFNTPNRAGACGYYGRPAPLTSAGIRSVFSTQYNSVLALRIKPENWHDIAAILSIPESGLPKIVQGYERVSSTIPANHLLNATDACERIRSPFSEDEYRTNSRYWTAEHRQWWSSATECPAEDRSQTSPPPICSSVYNFYISVFFTKRDLAKLVKNYLNDDRTS